MIKQYFKQAWTMMRQNKLFTSIDVAGTGLSIAFTMVLFIIYYVKFAPVYPEYNRNRMLVISSMGVASKGKEQMNMCNDGVSPKMAELLKGLPHLDKMALACLNGWQNYAVTLPGSNELLEVCPGLVDAGFWQVFTFRFLSGKPFDETAVEADLPVVVLTESLAKRIFASTDVVGKYFVYNGNEMQVVGVVEDANGTTPATAAHLYLPLYNGGLARHDPQTPGLMGANTLYLTATSEADLETLRNEVVDALNRNSQADQEWEHYYEGQPDVWWKSVFRDSCGVAPKIADRLRSIVYMLLALLFIPAMNLCGLISSRMDERMSELGVRKAYGATNAGLIAQVLTENLLLTIVGGLFGLFVAYFIAWAGADWVFYMFDRYLSTYSLEASCTAEMLFNPTIFLVVLGLCLLLNVISALVPTMLLLRHSIIYYIQTKR